MSVRSLVHSLALVPALAAALVAGPPQSAELSESARAFLDKALATMEAQSVMTNEVDWTELRARTLQRASGAQTTQNTYDALIFAIGELGDGHSFLITPDGDSSWALEPDDLPKQPLGELLEGGFAYVVVPGYLGQDEASNLAYARDLLRVVADLDARRPRGWIVDLRYDTGGNMWPMLAGLAPILGDGPCGAFVNADGGRSEWYVQGSAVGVNGSPFLDLGDDGVQLAQPDPVVAVLTGDQTASSGEAVAIAFRGRPCSRSFGQPTAGVSTANNTIWLGDGSLLFLTVATDADRRGTLYGQEVVPDQLVEGELVSVPEPQTDPVVRAALAWLSEQVPDRAVPVMATTTTRIFRLGVSDAGPAVGELLRTERESFAADGRRLRTEARDPDDALLSTFVLSHDEQGRPESARDYAGDETRPSVERFTYDGTGRRRFIEYINPDGSVSDYGEYVLDDRGLSTERIYMRPDRSVYGRDVESYDANGDSRGWTFTRTSGTQTVVNSWEYLVYDDRGSWTRRVLVRDDVPVELHAREIEYGVAPAPDESGRARRARVEPEVFASGAVSVTGSIENTLSFSPDGNTVLFSRTDDWIDQTPLVSSFADGTWSAPRPAGFADVVYNAHFGEDGCVFYATRSGDDVMRSYRVEPRGDGWAAPTDLEQAFGIRGNYFCLVPGALYFHRDGELYRAARSDDRFERPVTLGAAINTDDGVEFGAWIDPSERLLIFTRSVEDDEQRSGLFVSERRPDGWSTPRKLPLAYGWSATVAPDGQLCYTTDEYSADTDIVCVPLDALGIELPE